jgi:ATPase subunit of ABC transporter with duplicated ATPase domains
MKQQTKSNHAKQTESNQAKQNKKPSSKTKQANKQTKRQQENSIQSKQSQQSTSNQIKHAKTKESKKKQPNKQKTSTQTSPKPTFKSRRFWPHVSNFSDPIQCFFIWIHPAPHLHSVQLNFRKGECVCAAGEAE